MRSGVRQRVGLVGVAAVLLVAACSSPAPTPVGTLGTASGAANPFAVQGGATPSSSPTPTVVVAPVTTAHPCVGAPNPTRWNHVIWIWMENKPATAVVGSPSAPYITGLAGACASATDYHGVAHPSLPNYLAATSGSVHGVTDDGPPSAHPLSGESVFGQVAAAGLQWRAYNESMPTACAQASAGTYAAKHNPAVYYTAISTECQMFDVGIDQLSTDIAADSLPSFAFVTPNLCNDMHDCPIATGDAWLKGMLPTLLGSAAYKRGDTAIFVVWDEDDGSHNNRVPLLVIAPPVKPGTSIATRLDHYGLLRTTEGMLGLAPLGNAASATRIPGL